MRNSALRKLLIALGALSLLLHPPAGSAQTTSADTATAVSRVPPATRPDSLPRPVFQNPTPSLQWYHLGLGGAVVGLATLADEGLRNSVQRHRSSTKDDVAAVFRRMGQAEVFGTVGLGTIAAGIISGNPRLRRAGERMSAGMLLAAFITMGAKESVGRRRPQSPTDAFQFKPFSGNDSWPSGHTTMAFALATGVADEVHSLPVTIGLYAAASMTGWSRINDDKHWLSDVVTGALVGITSTKLMNGHWRVLGVHAPKFLLEPGAVGVSLNF